MLKAVTLGFALTSCTVAIHAAGSSWWIRQLKANAARRKAEKAPRRPTWVLCVSCTFIVALHIAEVLLWASTYWFFTHSPEIVNFEDAIYFSMVTFTSLGYGDIVLRDGSRLLSGIQAMNGLLMFGWSSALFFSIVQRMWEPEITGGDR